MHAAMQKRSRAAGEVKTPHPDKAVVEHGTDTFFISFKTFGPLIEGLAVMHPHVLTVDKV